MPLIKSFKPRSKPTQAISYWFGLSLIAPVYFGLVSLHHSLNQEYIVQDDARIHIVWLQKFVDPQLFSDDLIAQYYLAIQPVGFKCFYWLMAQIGVEPMLLAKVLPTLLALITTIYLFKLSLQILPVPACAFLTTLILNQNIWLKDDLISATPRAFIYPLFAAFLYYLLRRSLIPCLFIIVLQGLFYPQMLLVEVSILAVRLFHWQDHSLRLTQNKQNYVFFLSGAAIALIVILMFSLNVSQEFGPLITAEQMQAMPEFGPDGRREYFGVDPLSFMFRGASGLRFPLFPPIIWVSIALPFLLNSRLPLVRSITPEVKLLLQISLASLAMFLLAHVLFPKLYLPSRYTFYSFRFVMAIAAGLVLTIWLDAVWRWLQQKRQAQAKLNRKESLWVGGLGLFAIVVLTLPAVPSLFLPCQGWVAGKAPGVYQFLASQPKEVRVAALAKETNNLPAFSHRSVLVSPELALAYHPAFYSQMQQRITDILRAQYSSNLSEVRAVLQKYRIGIWMVERDFFDPDYLLQQAWLIHSSINPTVLETVARLKQGETPALKQAMSQCSAFSEANLVLLDAECIKTIQSE
jgi:hypothetical protein